MKNILLYCYGYLYTLIERIRTKRYSLPLSHVGEGSEIMQGFRFTGGNNISIGKNTHISHDVDIIAKEAKVTIGNDCMIAQSVMFVTTMHKFDNLKIPMKEQGETHKPITIEDDVWIGAKSIVLQGVTIGRGSVIGAGAIVNKDIPEYSIAVGVPAKVIKRRK